MTEQQHAATDGKKTVTIVINGRQKEVPKGEMTFAEIVALAEGLPTGPNIVYTILFRKGDNEHRPEGSLVEGATVKVKEGTVFNVTATDRS